MTLPNPRLPARKNVYANIVVDNYKPKSAEYDPYCHDPSNDVNLFHIHPTSDLVNSVHSLVRIINLQVYHWSGVRL